MSRARWLLIAALLAGCGAPSVAEPPAIRYGEAGCATCRMLINEERFAAALRTATGEAEVFDGIGCLLQYQVAHPGRATRVWVHDYESGRWLPSEQAFFVHSPELVTPMGDGLIAVTARPRADALASTLHGRVMTWDQVSHK